LLPGSIVNVLTQPGEVPVVQFGMLVEITSMPVNIAKAYFEIQQLREEIRRAELALRISFARPPNRPRHTGLMNARSSQAINPQMPLLKRGGN
jgi:hypothetical protein